MLIYPAAVFLGFGLSAMFVNALSFGAELLGDNKVILLVESNVQSLLFNTSCLYLYPLTRNYHKYFSKILVKVCIVVYQAFF